MKKKRLGEVLQERGQISAASLQQLFQEQAGKVIRLGELILERGLVDKSALIEALQEVSRISYLDCSTVRCEKGPAGNPRTGRETTGDTSDPRGKFRVSNSDGRTTEFGGHRRAQIHIR